MVDIALINADSNRKNIFNVINLLEFIWKCNAIKLLNKYILYNVTLYNILILQYIFKLGKLLDIFRLMYSRTYFSNRLQNQIDRKIIQKS